MSKLENYQILGLKRRLPKVYASAWGAMRLIETPGANESEIIQDRFLNAIDEAIEACEQLKQVRKEIGGQGL